MKFLNVLRAIFIDSSRLSLSSIPPNISPSTGIPSRFDVQAAGPPPRVCGYPVFEKRSLVPDQSPEDIGALPDTFLKLLANCFKVVSFHPGLPFFKSAKFLL